ncbi:sulfatase-like hydrolase/transferase [Paucibacter sp. PLA-PC-4]|uniref:sulfatase-like hydrolase/transferase n=1 Tax=Paucibacter sp. PLA-PC-4 TaxID=2993655 RepID=UPI00224B2C58|nr:sulfatase-like hydrolase/transferase [Paucibacter sp. PLA-PC-4]MCX2865124.1 sulfatase-like hydrolase/transferase [Paucibacter sp. PLA-PC-4]
MTHWPSPSAQALRYALLSLAALAAIALSETILQSPSSLYVAFQPAAFVREGWALLCIVSGMALAGACLDQQRRPPWLAAATRGLLLLLLFVGLFQIFRRSLASTLVLNTLLKAGLLGFCFVAAIAAVWRLKPMTQWRLASACGVTVLVIFALQPGMPGYLLNILRPQPAAAMISATPPEGTPRRTVVLILDEWDFEVSTKEQLFESEPMRELLAQSFFAERAMPAGPSTLSSIPGMLTGQRFGKVDSGGSGFLLNERGERFDASTPMLFTDLASTGRSHAVVGFYHDYCAVVRTARACHAEPVQFFPGWWSSLSRAFKRQQEFDSPYSDFLQQWSGTYQKLSEHAVHEVADRRNSMVWLHLNVPHPPVAAAGAVPRSLAEDYRANLQQMQSLIAELRATLERAGGDSALVLTSDHWLREKELWAGVYERQRGPGSGSAGKSDDQHVPFIVWFSGAKAQGMSGAPALSTTALRELVPALMERRINSPAGVAEFFAGRKDLVEPFRSSNGASVH